ncbi:hypothetical protein [Orbus mooreae]|uniref:hypothetical protein n=1 Tax=Orbus mooreae TaxID=3074107 RepID=UPI00370D61E6
MNKLESQILINDLKLKIKELESNNHRATWKIRNEARLSMIGHIVDDLENETDVNKIKEYLKWQLNYWGKEVNKNETTSD